MRTQFMRSVRGSAYACLGLLALLGVANSARAENPTAVPVPGLPTLLLGGYDLNALGYHLDEFFVSGRAASYTLIAAATEDGRWNAVPTGDAPYTTRIVVIAPTDPRKFNGTVVVEWLNDTSGNDIAGDWTVTHRELLRGGYAYVAVSAQRIGVEGGQGILGMAGAFLKKANPERYGTLSHPGDAFAFDIFSDIGRLLRGPEVKTILGPLVPERLLAVGVSQSAIFLTTYINAVDRLAKIYDGVLVDSRFGNAAPLDGSRLGGRGIPKYVKFRTNLRVPVIVTETETDLLGGGPSGYAGARQPDNKRLRVWEVAGTAHADNYFIMGAYSGAGTGPGPAPIEKLAAVYAPISEVGGVKLAKPINNAPQHHYVVEAALWHLDQWVRSGKAPPTGKPIKLTNDMAHPFVLDANGNVAGGIRTPWVDVPTGRLSGVLSAAGWAGIFGSSEPFDAAALQRLYPGGKPDYLKKFEASLNATIKAGFILPADRQEILNLAAATYHATP